MIKKPHILDEEQPHTWRDFKQRQKNFKVPEVRKLTTQFDGLNV